MAEGQASTKKGAEGMETGMGCGGEKRTHAVTKVLQSIARKEMAMSRLLEAQGDRLRAILNGTAAGDETLTQADDALQKTMEKLIRIEAIQQAKLTLLRDHLLCACARDAEDADDAWPDENEADDESAAIIGDNA